MLIPGVYIKGNDLAGILNGKIKALLETSMINWSALLVLYHDKVKLTSPGHFPGNSSQVSWPSVDCPPPQPPPHPRRSPTGSLGQALISSSMDPVVLILICIIFIQGVCQGFDPHETADIGQGVQFDTVQPDAVCRSLCESEAGGAEESRSAATLSALHHCSSFHSRTILGPL